MFSTSVSNRTLALQKIELDNAQGTWELLNDPERLAAMTPQEIDSLPLRVGPMAAAKVVAAAQHVKQNQAHLEDAKLDKDMFNGIAGIALNIDTVHPSKPQALELTRLRDAVESEIRRRQQAAKRPLFDEEKRDAIQNTIDNKVITGWWGSEKPASMLTSEELKGAKVNIVSGTLPNGQPAYKAIELGSIPDTFKKDTIRALNAKGIPVTERLIGQAWWDKNNQKK
jgi:hypothetical protein